MMCYMKNLKKVRYLLEIYHSKAYFFYPTLVFINIRIMEVNKVLQDLERRHPGEIEYLQAVHEVLESIRKFIIRTRSLKKQVSLNDWLNPIAY